MIQKIVLAFLLLLPIAALTQIADSAQRMVRLQGAVNFRDIGGYKTNNGRHVKWGKIYRSAEISNLTGDDLNTLQALHINYVLDFRGPEEVNAAPDKLPAGAVRISLPASSENVGDKSKTMQFMSTASSGDSIMFPFYTNTDPFARRYEPVFRTLLNNSPDSAVLYHCTAGKDRTGISTALVLYALGVDEQTIMDDYLASNYYRMADLQRMKKMLMDNYHVKEGVVNDVMGVKQQYLQATFDAIRSKYGSIENFLKQEMGIGEKEIQQLRDKYTD